MMQTQASRTAVFAAIGRGLHRERHAQPWVLDDPHALALVGPAWSDIYATLLPAFGEAVIDEAIGFVCARSRYAEDRLAAGRFTQYVILGAGLDSFAWRRPDLGSLRVFEVDHPASQAAKRERLEALALAAGDRHVFAPIDFETETLRDGLDAVGLDWSQPTLFSCLGVLAYLTAEAIATMLRTVACAAPGSELVASYAVTAEYLDANGEAFLDTLSRLAAESGEGIQSFHAPSDIERVLEDCGLKLAEDLSREALHQRYFADRDDELTPYTTERLIIASTGPGS